MLARTRIPRCRVWCLAVLPFYACAGGDGAPVSQDPFCVEALARVDSFAATLADLPTAGRGGTVTAAVIQDLEGMNSLTTSEYEARQHQIFVNHMTLVQFGPGPDFEPRPYLAESWSLSPDATVLEFTLRDDVFWHDGTPTTARDVVFTYERARDEESGFANPSFFQSYQSAELVDERTVRFVLSPQPMPLDAWRVTAIMPEHLLGDVASIDLEGHPYGLLCPVGNGPFRFASHTPNASWVFEAHPGFSTDLGGPPSIDRYVLRIIPDQSTILNELRSGGIDIYPIMRADQAPNVEQLEGLRVISFPGLDYSFIAWNMRSEKLDDFRVRKALTLGIDRQAIVDQLIVGYGMVADHGVPPMLWQFDETASTLPYDPSEAERLLDEAGWTDRDGDGVRENAAGTPLTIELLFPSSNELRANIAQVVQAQLGTVGVAIQATGLEGGTLVGRVFSADREFEAFTLNYTTEFALNDYDLYHSQSGGNLAWSGMDDPELDRMLEVLQTPLPRAEAKALWAEYQDRIRNLSPWTHLYFGERIAGVADRLDGVTMDVRGEWQSIHDWTVGNR